MKKYFCYGKKDFCASLRCDRECPHYDGSGGEYQEAPMTNADRIRAMSDEELCDLLDEWWCMGANNDERLSYADERLAWLRQPAGEEDKHETD